MFSIVKKEDSILDTLLRCSDNEVLDISKVDDILNPQSGGVRFSSRFIDNFSGDGDPEEISSKVIKILEDVLISLGSQKFKENIFKEFKSIYDVEERGKHKYSYINVFGENFVAGRKILEKAKICGEFRTNESLKIVSSLLEDFDPTVRSEAIKILYSFDELMIKEDEILVGRSINRLIDCPYYVRKNALDFCDNKNIRVNNEQFNSISSTLAKRIEDDEDAYKDDLIKIVN